MKKSQSLPDKGLLHQTGDVPEVTQSLTQSDTGLLRTPTSC